MEDINKFLAGMNKDIHPNSQPDNTIRHAMNFVAMSNDGNLYSLTNEDGTTIMSNISFPDGFQVIGYSVLSKDIIVVLAHPNGYSQVGYITEDTNLDVTYGKYHPVGPVDSLGNVPNNNSELGFTINRPVDCRSRKLINGHRILYFTDNNVPFGRVDLDDPPHVGTVLDEVKLTFNQTIPRIEVSAILENVSSTIRPGIYQFVTRYVTNTGGVTTFGIPSNPLPMVPTSRDVGPDNYHGEFYEFGVINKNIVLNITNIDTQYQELEIVAIYYEGSQSVFKSVVVGQIPITGNTASFTFTGPVTENEVIVTREELRKIPISYDRAKCIEQKDNVLFLSNLSSTRSNYDDLLQHVANNVRVKYRIDEIQFSGRGENSQTQILVFAPAGTPYKSGITEVDIIFTDNVDPTTGATLSNYLINKPGMPASGMVSIVDSTLILNNDTITVGAGPAQAAVVFTAKTAAPGADEFLIVSGDNVQTALNLVNAINASGSVTEYFAYLSGTDVIIVWDSITLAANGVTVTASGAGVTTTNFAGASVTPYTEVPTSATVNGPIVTLTFPSVVTTSDTLQITGVVEAAGDPTRTYTTGTNTSLPIAAEAPGGTSNTFPIGFTDYTNEFLTATEKGYRRNEVYSLAFMLIWKDGSSSVPFHIPAYAGYVSDPAFPAQNRFEPTGLDVWPSFSVNPTSGGFVGTYVSQTEYPLDQNYPGNQPGDDTGAQGPGVNTVRKVRHHLMPALKNEPHFRVDAQGNTLLRVLGLEFEFGVSIPMNVLTDVQEIVFLRERRNTDQNRSILAQGVINRQVIMADDYQNNGYVQGTAQPGPAGPFASVRSGYYATEMLFFDNCESAAFTGDVRQKSSGKTNRGLVYPNYAGSDSAGDYGDGQRISSQVLEDRAFFHSPETNLLTGYKPDPGSIIGADMVPEMLFIGDYQRVNFDFSHWDYDSPGLKGTDFMTKYMYADHYANYVGYETTLTANRRTIQRARFADPGKLRLPALDPSIPNLNTGTRWTQGGLEIKVNGNFTNPGGSKFIPQNQAKIRNLPGTGCTSDCEGFYQTDSVWDSFDNLPTGSGAAIKLARLRRYLYNIMLNNAQQYGQISTASYMPIHRASPFTGGGSFETNYLNVFGGDTFITKYSVNTGNLLVYFPYRRDGDTSINRPDKSSSFRPNGYGQIDGIERGGATSGGPGLAHGWDFRNCMYFFVESNINTHYRHRPADETQQDYFPNNNNLSSLLMSFFPYLGEINSYNTQYSYENNVKEYYPKGSTQQSISEFECRTIYSEKASQDDTLDAYRSFLQNNFYDLPSNTGPIWDSFVAYGTLFLHTPKSLWKTFAEPAATIQGGNISDAVLGTGGLFVRPSVEVLTTEGGYGGSISQFGGTNTQIGYIFPDLLQGKIFAVAMGEYGPYLKELSEEGMQTYMHQNLPAGIVKDPLTGELDMTNVTTRNSNLIDNPFNQIGLNGGYDYKLKRYFLVKHGPVPFSITYSVLLQNWISFHSYFPHVILPFDNNLFFFRNFDFLGNPITLQTWNMNTGPKGTYFGQVYNSELDYVSAQVKNKEKSFQNLVINSISKDRATGVKVKNDNFETLQVFNDKNNTGIYTLVDGNTWNPTKSSGETFIKFRQNEYRVAIPRDAVLNNAADIFDPLNLDQNQPFAERIKGDYAQFRLTYNNAPNYEFVLNFISTIFNINMR